MIGALLAKTWLIERLRIVQFSFGEQQITLMTSSTSKFSLELVRCKSTQVCIPRAIPLRSLAVFTLRSYSILRRAILTLVNRKAL